MKPCPWCNDDDSELDMVTIPTSTEPGYAIACSNCGCVGPMGKDEKQAIDKWEDRKARA
jgi:Lar family restriction alleviation protein